ncbi:cystathionine-beta-synthase domain-containing protein [Heterostelium album PN500]|uniref:Cystathionine-beta-synthase domain-containing protein n=1 Tax=Heterostelium pallidum (strain ATCC 26659 / Pp 5 / PN500) TaxID=670386 RepID=D3BQY1_HETP5|nr:cystathionine-beta-synthase domain-containing protein [Heterostelium album PN500]EFA76167.1 cystathionine-beta-synthase domain-containing protein [Heterostelium album PN500]|eukprot:XP_020428301.1 cystathionine-beta-synthase domain-containing protein [Heterostelium album PN500]
MIKPNKTLTYSILLSSMWYTDEDETVSELLDNIEKEETTLIKKKAFYNSHQQQLMQFSRGTKTPSPPLIIANNKQQQQQEEQQLDNHFNNNNNRKMNNNDEDEMRVSVERIGSGPIALNSDSHSRSPSQSPSNHMTASSDAMFVIEDDSTPSMSTSINLKLPNFISSTSSNDNLQKPTAITPSSSNNNNNNSNNNNNNSNNSNNNSNNNNNNNTDDTDDNPLKKASTIVTPLKLSSDDLLLNNNNTNSSSSGDNNNNNNNNRDDISTSTTTTSTTVTTATQLTSSSSSSTDINTTDMGIHRIETFWREINVERPKTLIYTEPETNLYDAATLLLQYRIHRLPVVDKKETNSILHILTHSRILAFMMKSLPDLPTPLLSCTLGSLGIGTFEKVCTVHTHTPLIKVLELLAEKKISAVPIIDENGKVIDVYSKSDVTLMAKQGNLSPSDLDKPVHQVLTTFTKLWQRAEQTYTCTKNDKLGDVIEKCIKKRVHRLVCVDSAKKVEGILSLSDILSFLLNKK